MPSQESSRDYDLLDRLVEEFNDRFRRGERPSVHEYCSRYPTLADDLRELIPAIAQVEQAKDVATDDAPPTQPSIAPPLENLGDYHILREIGHGGMGVVYEAEQVSLGRRVALKVLTQGLLRKDKLKRRFEREAKAAAKLHHTNIVPVFGTGEEQGTPYYVMQFIQGMGLDIVIDELARMGSGGEFVAPTVTAPGPCRADVSAVDIARSLLTGKYPAPASEADGADPANGITVTAVHDGDEPSPVPFSPPRPESVSRFSDHSGASSSVSLPGQSNPDPRGRKLTYWQSVARIGVQVADALEYAHRQGVLHRDIKPSNLLLDLKGTVWVTDFGLAKAEGTDNLTHTGDILGTLRYMPPEAFDGRTDARTDVYSLGLTLYELAARRPAFDERNRQQLIKQVTTAEPTRLTSLVPNVPRDLATIIEKAIEKDASRRYATAAELHADLQHFLDDEPILARRQTQIERYRRWARRNPGIAILGGVLTAVLVLATVASLIVAGQMTTLARKEAQSADEERIAREDAVAAKQREEAARKNADTALIKAEENYRRSREAVNDYLTAVSDDDRLKESGLESLRSELLQSALSFYEEFLKERGNDPSLRRELAEVYYKVGDVQVDLKQKADDSFAQSQQLYELLVAQTPDDPDLQNGLAKVLSHRSRHAEAIAIWEKLVRPDRPDYLQDLGIAYHAIANQAGNKSNATPVSGSTVDPAKELDYLRKALAVREQLVRLRPDDPEARHGLSLSLNNIAASMSGDREHDIRKELYRRAARESETAYQLIPRDRYARLVMLTLQNFGLEAEKIGLFEESITAYQRATEVAQKLGREKPESPNVSSLGINNYFALARLYHRLHRLDEASREIREGLELLRQLRIRKGDYPYNAVRLQLLALTIAEEQKKDVDGRVANVEREAAAAVELLRQYILSNRISVNYLETNDKLAPLRDRPDYRALMNQSGRYQAANALARATRTTPADRVEACRQILFILREMSAKDPNSPIAQEVLAQAYEDLAEACVGAGQHKEAGDAYANAQTIRRRQLAESPNDPEPFLKMIRSQKAGAWALKKTGRFEDAIRLANSVAESVKERLRSSPKNLTLRSEMSRIYLMTGRVFAAFGMWDKALESMRDGFAIQTPAEYLIWYSRAMVLLETRDEIGFRQLVEKILDLGSRFEQTDGIHRARILLAAPPRSDRHRDVLTSLPERFEWKQDQPDWQTWIRGMASVRLGDAEKGISTLQSVNMGNYQGLKWSALALAYHRLGRKDEAKDALREAEEFETQTIRDIVIADNLALTDFFEDWLLQKQLCREARRLIRGETEPVLPYDRLHRGRVLLAGGEADKADAEFAAAIAGHEDDGDVRLTRALMYARIGRTNQRDEELTAVRALRSATPLAWARTGRQFEAIGDRVRANEAGARAAEAGELNAFLQAGWWVSGPFIRSQNYFRSDALFIDEMTAPNREIDPSKPFVYFLRSRSESWKSVPSAADGRIQFEFANGLAGLTYSYFGTTRVYTTEDRTATLLFRSIPGASLRVNGRPVYVIPPSKTAVPDEAVRVPVFLRKGSNTLFLQFPFDNKNPFLCECRFEERSPSKSERDDFARLVESESDRPWRWVEYGWNLGRRGLDEESKKAMERAIELKPDDPAVLTHRGLAFADLGQWDDAAADLARAIDLQPAVTPSWLAHHGGVWDEISRSDELFDRVGKLRPTLVNLWIQRTQYLASTGRWDDANRVMDRLLEIDSTDHMTWHVLPGIRLMSGKFDAYRNDCRAIRDRLVKATDSLIVQRLATAGLIAPAGDDIAAAILAKMKTTPKDSRSYNYHELALAHAYYRVGDFPRAEETLNAIYQGEGQGQCIVAALRAMIAYRGGRIDDARVLLASARGDFSRFAKPGPDEFQPRWFNWCEAEIIIREAESLIPLASAASPTPMSDNAENRDRNRQARADQYATRLALAMIRRDIGNADGAEKELRSLVEELKTMAAEDPSNPDHRAKLGLASRQLGRLLIETDRVAEGFAELDGAVALVNQPDSGIPGLAHHRLELATAFLAAGEQALQMSPSATADDAWRKAIELARRNIKDRSSDPKPSAASVGEWLVLLLAHTRRGETGEARAALRNAVDSLTKNKGVNAIKPLYRQVILGLGLFSPEAADLFRANAEPTPGNLTAAIEKSPDDAKVHSARGDWYSMRGLWNSAATDYAAATKRDKVTYMRNIYALKLAGAYVAGNDLGNYRTLCRTMIDEWKLTFSDFDASRVLRTNSLIPNPGFPRERLEKLIPVLQSGELPTMNWTFSLSKALYEYRCGRFHDAIAATLISREKLAIQRNDPLSDTSNVLAFNLCVEAMARFRLGQKAEAEKLLAEARPIMEKNVPGVDLNLTSDLHEWINAHLLYRETLVLLEPGRSK